MLNIKKYKHLILWIPTVAVMIIIFYFSSRTAGESHNQSSWVAELISGLFNVDGKLLSVVIAIVRRLAHFSEFLLLGITVVFALRGYKIKKIKMIFLGALICLIYAISDEIHQSFVPGRAAQLSDIAVDFSGSLFGIGLTMILFKIKNLYINLRRSKQK